ncbi:MAG: hydrolase [Suipraeoptans sp.]
MRARKEDSVAVLIDIQEKLVPVMEHKEELVANCSNFVQGLRALDIPIVATRQYPKGLGNLNLEILEALGEHEPFDKTSFSVYGDTKIKNQIDGLGKKNIFLFGIETHICVLQSVIDFQAAGYQVYLVCDCCDSRHEKDHAIALERAMSEGALLTTREAAMFELQGIASGDTFKKISALVKKL